MIDEYFTALKTRIEAGTGLAGKVYDTVRLDAAGALIRDNYVVLYAPVPVDTPQERFSQVQTFADTVEFEVDFRVVGVSPQAVRLTLSRVLTQLVGHQVAITGRVPAKVTVSGGSRVREDQSVKPFLYYADASAEWVSRPS
ncbi:hypothetical protein J2Y46_002607 [Microbacterium sp. BE35]|uniref:hypothetical protein n=1 Tax=Microbacterium sp. BE35 TaxID=2817773 RepID=UPI00286766E0|nr:hypothetical protein [Microbacterium sp. BE35]MDR7189781.1 hypothetical protein [Microbacterium sp. BE35]